MISSVFPTVLIGVVTVIKLLFDSIPNIHWVITIMLLLIWLVIRWSLGHRFELIKEYKLLMNPLEKLTTIHSSMSVWHVVMNTLRNEKNLGPCWVYYFDEKGKNINAAFVDLNSDLEKLIGNPYRLLIKNTASDIEQRFYSLVEDNKKLSEVYIEMINTQSISTNESNYEIIKKEYNDFYYRLKQSRDKFTELRIAFKDEFFSPLPEIWFPSSIVIY